MSSSGKRAAKIVETGLGAIGRIKILRVLAKSREGPLTRYAIEKYSGLKHKDVVANLTVLVNIGWVEQLPTKPAKFRISLDNEAVTHLIEFFHKVQYI